jgi:predicted nucleic acid-binding protein
VNLYLDSSALLKRYLIEEGSTEVRSALEEATSFAGSRIGFVETLRALMGNSDLSAQARRDWQSIDVVEVSAVVCERAVRVARERSLRSLDAIHLASALVIATDDLTFATFDRRLHAAAQAEGLTTLPTSLS